jgi:hypothetical protein
LICLLRKVIAIPGKPIATASQKVIIVFKIS